MFGRKFLDYVRFERWILILIVVVFVVRLGFSLNGASFSQIRFVSINLVLLVGWIYCAIAVHVRKFGGYRQLFGLLLVQNALAHKLIALAIVISIVTAKANIFTAPNHLQSRRPPSTRRLVRVKSCPLGFNPPEGWLCARMILAA